MKVYLSGPMRNTTPDQNKELFYARAGQLEQRGFVVFNPHEISREVRLQHGVGEWDFGALPVEAFLRADYAYVTQSDLVAILPGWEKSDGCRKEVRVARDLAIPVWPVQYVLDQIHPGWKLASHLNLQPSLELSESAVQEAHRLVHGDRMAAYGHPIEDYTRTGRIWGAIIDGWLRRQPGFETINPVPDLDPRIAALMMAGVKISREVNGPKHDNRVDLAGYAEVANMIAERQGKP